MTIEEAKEAASGMLPGREAAGGTLLPSHDIPDAAYYLGQVLRRGLLNDVELRSALQQRVDLLWRGTRNSRHLFALANLRAALKGR